MVFGSLFRKPKWQHKDASVRVQAIAEMSAEDIASNLSTFINDDADKVRLAVVPHVQDVGTLLTLSQEDSAKSVRDSAKKRYIAMLCGTEVGAPSVADRHALIGRVDSASVLDSVVYHADDVSLRLLALAKIDKVSTLSQLVRSDSEQAIRDAALAKITDENALQVLLKDRRALTEAMHQEIEQRIEAARIARNDPAMLHEVRVRLCKKMEQLATLADWRKALAEMDGVDAEWQAAQGEPDATLHARYERARKVVLSTATEYQRLESGEKIPTDKERAAEHRVDFLAKRILAHARDVESQTEAAAKHFNLDNADDVLLALEAEWQAEPESEFKAAKQNELDQALAAMRQHINAARKRNDGALEKVCEQSRRLLQFDADVITTQHLKRLRDDWRNAVQGHAGTVPKRLADKFEHNLAQAEAKHAEDLQRAQTDLPQLETEIVTLTEQAEEGQLQAVRKALPGFKQRYQRVQKMLHGEPVKVVGRKLARLEAIQQDLGGWQNWGNEQKREELCQKAEALSVFETEDLEGLFAALKRLQQAWKTLDESEKGSKRQNQAVWARFQTANNVTFERCRPHLELLSQQRTEKRQQFTTLCDELEQAAQQTGDALDYKQLARLQTNGKRAMRELDQLDAKARGNVARRLRAALTTISGQLDSYYQDVKTAKQALIEKAQQLLTQDDNQAAIDGIKRLQREWPTTGTADRKTEQALWKQFRGVCDQIFAQREEQKEQVQAERAAKAEDLSLLVEKMESIAVCEPAMVVDKLSEFKALVAQWQAHEAYANKDRSLKKVAQRASSAQEKVEAKRQQHAQQKDWDELALLLLRHAQCAQLEGELVGADALEQMLSQLPPSSIKAGEAAVKARVQQCANGKAEGDAKRANELLFDLEILAGVDSPAKHADARMEYQIARLSSDMASSTEGSTASYKAVKQLVLQYISPEVMPIPMDQHMDHQDRLVAVIEKARA